MRTKILKKAFRYRLVPTAAQDERLRFMAGCRRFIYNWGLARRSSFYKENLRSIPKKQLSAELTTLKADPDKLWLKDADSQMLQQALVDLDRAFASFFEKRACYPKFKNKKTDPLRFRIPQRVKVRGSEVYCPKAGWIRFRKSREVEGKVKSATFKRDVCGKWYVTLVCHIEVPDVKLPVPAPDKTVGVDAGLKVFLVLSSGERVAAPRFYRKDERKLRRVQRSLSRKERGSKNYLKARGKVACVHRKVADKRRDFLHKLSTRIVSEYDAICIEDLNLEGLARTKLAKSFTDAAHGEFRRMLEYKSEWNMKHLAVVDRYFPSTRTCGGCGSLKIALTLHDRRWECGCGAVHDRDENAAENIRREGLRILRGEMIVAEGHPETLNARGADVRPPMRRPWAWKRERPRL